MFIIFEAQNDRFGKQAQSHKTWIYRIPVSKSQKACHRKYKTKASLFFKAAQLLRQLDRSKGLFQIKALVAVAVMQIPCRHRNPPPAFRENASSSE